MKFCTDTGDPQRVNSTYFGDSLTFHLAPPAGHVFDSSCKIPSTSWIFTTFATDIHGSQRMNPTDFVDLTFSSKAPAAG